MEEQVQEINEKKKFEIKDKKLIIFLVIFTILNLIIAIFLLSFEHSQSENLNPFQIVIDKLQEEREYIHNQIVSKKSQIECTEVIDEEEYIEVDIYVDFYDEYMEPIQIPEICTDCTIREAGEVISVHSFELTDQFVGLKYLIVTNTAEYEGYEYKQTHRLLVNDDYSEIYMFYNLSDSNLDLSENSAYKEEYYLTLQTNLLPDVLSDTSLIKTTNSFYFNPSYYPGYTNEYELSEINKEIFDTYEDIPIYINIDNPNSYLIVTKEQFLVAIDFIPSLSIRAETEPYPITWEGDIENTFNFDYGYDICGGGGLRIVDIEKDELTITGYKTGTEEPIYEYANKDHTELKKIYDEDYIKYIYEYEEKPNGIDPLTYEEFLAHHPVLFWEDETGRMIMFYNARFVIVGGCAKPIVYLYPTNKTNISVKVLPTTGYLTFTYPKYNDMWNVTASPSGKLVDAAGDVYDYLWWESKSEYLPTVNDGFVVKYDSLSSFFDVVLRKAGFVQNEINDFKDYWVPTMSSTYSPYFKISFLQNKEVDDLAKLVIYPVPDTEIRIFMIYDRLDDYIEVPIQDIQNTQRNGFVVTEWGGTRR